MEFYILSQREVVMYAKQYINCKIAVISITEGNDSQPDFTSAMIGEHQILRLQFHDIDREVSNCTVFSIDDAKKILNFVEHYIDYVDFFLVHCHAGISRSAGVAAALSKIYNKTDKYIFNCGKYCPNMMVYRTILNEYNREGNNYE